MLKLTLPALILACSASPRADVQSTLYRIAIAHSRGASLHLFNASTGRAYHPTTPVATATIYKQFAQAHHDIHIGLMGLSRHTLKRWKVKPIDVTDPCMNVRIASLELARLLPRRVNQHRLHKVLASYWNVFEPNTVGAIDWGAMVLAQPGINVAKQSRSKRQRASVMYTVHRTNLIGGKAKTHAFGKRSTAMIQKFERPEPTRKIPAGKKASIKNGKNAPKKQTPSGKQTSTKKKNNTKQKQKTIKLKTKDMAPYHPDGAQRPVTDRRI